MILGEFDERGRPFVRGRLVAPRLEIDESVLFLLDTGADVTCLHPADAKNVDLPFDQLRNETSYRGVGGTSPYFVEPVILSFTDKLQARLYTVQLLIAEPNRSNEVLPSLLGRDVINNWHIEYDPTRSRLECNVRHADFTFNAT